MPFPMDRRTGNAARRYAFEHTRVLEPEDTPSAGLRLRNAQYNWGYPAALKNAIDHGLQRVGRQGLQ